MTPAALLAFMLSLVGGRAPDGLVQYRDAIIATDASPEELRVLAVVAKHETYYHLTSRTPPFGLTDREQRGLPRLTIPASAPRRPRGAALHPRSMRRRRSAFVV